eukprot:421085-Karenia_brevis.AAC.1
MAHLSDKRRPKCWNKISTERFQPLPLERVAELDEQDRVARREAQRKGKSHPEAVGPARDVEGK